MRNLAYKWSQSQPPPAAFSWCDLGYETLQLTHGPTVSLEKLRSIAAHLLDRLDVSLKDLTFGWVGSLEKIFGSEDASNTEPFWSPIKDHSRVILEAMFNRAGISNHNKKTVFLFFHVLHMFFCVSDKYYDSITNDLSPKAMDEYLAKSSKFVSLLLAAVHIMSGMPPRATELQVITIRNKKDQLRNIFFSHGKCFFFNTCFFLILILVFIKEPSCFCKTTRRQIISPTHQRKTVNFLIV
jgi:hypothetical protein